jgi:hypothetical protein
VEVYDAKSDTLLGIKDFRAEETVRVDVSRYARRVIDAQPLTGSGTAFVTDGRRAAEIRIRVNGVQSPTARLLWAAEAAARGGLLSPWTQERAVAWDECDEAAFAYEGEAGEAACTAMLSGQQGDFPVELSRAEITDGVTALRLDMADAAEKVRTAGGAPEDFYTMELRVELPDGKTKTRPYRLEACGGGGQRIAWLNPMGAIDRFTFPVIQGRKFNFATHEKTVTLASGYLRRETIDHLMRIAVSERVWLYDRTKQSHERAEVATGNLTLHENSPESLTLSFKLPWNCM